MLRARAVVVLLCVLVATPALAGCLAGPDDPVQPDARPAFAQQGQFDSTTFEIDVSANGSVRWTIVYRRGLDNSSETRQFRDFAEQFNGGETDLYTSFQGYASNVTGTASDRLGRDMEARGFQKRAYVREIAGREGVEDEEVLGDVEEPGEEGNSHISKRDKASCLRDIFFSAQVGSVCDDSTHTKTQ